MSNSAVVDLCGCLQNRSWTTDPWPHLIVSPFETSQIRAARDEVALLPSSAFTWQFTPRIHKGTLGDIAGFGPAVRTLWDAMAGGEFVTQLRELTGIEDLVAGTDGTFSGVFVTPPGGWQRVHEDFPKHPATGLWHRVAVLLYLSEWAPGSGGELELWDRSMAGEPTLIEPVAGRLVVFQPSSATLHGIRRVAADSTPRVALGVRYYSAAAPDGAPHHAMRRTVPRPGERLWDIRPGLRECFDYVRGTGLASRRSQRKAASRS